MDAMNARVLPGDKRASFPNLATSGFAPDTVSQT